MDNSNPLYVQVVFLFCQNPGLALPYVALQYHDVKIDIDIDMGIGKLWYELSEYNNFDIKRDKINNTDNFINLSEYLSHGFEQWHLMIYLLHH